MKDSDRQLNETKRAQVAIKFCWCLIVAIIAFPLLHYARRVLICDSFVIKGNSMSPTLISGQKVYVHKYILGPRIYKTMKTDSLDTHFDCVRLPGLRKLKVGDIAIVNSPEGQGWGKIRFKLNNVCAKRCMGIPGDTVRIVDGHYTCSSKSGQIISEEQERFFRSIPDSLFEISQCFSAGWFAGEGENWTIKNFGPLVIPCKGMTIPLDSVNVSHYSWVIEYETGIFPEWDAQVIEKKYTFKENYCFFVGDNAVDSRDSRYFGFIPEKFVVGVIR